MNQVTVKELLKKLDAFELSYINIWNKRGNTPKKGFSYHTVDDAIEAYGDYEVYEWEMEGGLVSLTKLSIKLRQENA